MKKEEIESNGVKDGKKELQYYARRQTKYANAGNHTQDRHEGNNCSRQKDREWDSLTFRINTGALSVAQEEIIFFDVKPCVLTAVWGIEALSKQMSTLLTPSRSVCVYKCDYVQWDNGQRAFYQTCGLGMSVMCCYSLFLLMERGRSQDLSGLTHLQTVSVWQHTSYVTLTAEL